ncbi:glutamine-hydrolyzing GMP synthase [Rubellimicrobium sp. CFH 75288]|uniref:glutamine-hydrolyzing GMP synthase n=1 Tax=Rubellimicrobium sp. CFH 75288 TaxID=2697034 RepID=UPI0014128A17|nr:glutamine-hydrolyzing GMP synthase [Rubellimicrobium sp. CFH 75288]NAZ36881.1 glutamine-hydrolyzing GMP synthase [Rubellimicrobium sp. CFH 75288]
MDQDTIPARHDRCLIVDFGSQVTQLIARRLRELHAYCEIHPYHAVTPAFLRDFAPRAVILSGGPASVYAEGAPLPPRELFDLGVPVLGICYGQQAMIQALGGAVERGDGRAEFGRARLEPAEPLDLLAGWFLDGPEQVWMSHGDHVARLAPGFRVFATSPGAPFAVVADPARHFYGVQFHPEVHHTPNGRTLYGNFLRIAGFRGDWTMGAFREEAIRRIREQVGETGRVICGLSGGVDSSVAAVLIHEAIGERLTCVFVDHGLLRKGEAEQVVAMFRDHYNIPLVHADESERFLTALEGIEDPEQKRKTIGRLFVEVFQEHAEAAGGAEFLAQGTLYPDVIESVSTGGPSVTIKSHHNVGGLPERMGLKLVEPLRELFKDEVRELGRELGLPDAFVGRHPFPGPGLAIRCPGAVTREKLAILREADAVFIDQIRRHGLYDAIWQAFAAILPVRTVGVMGDGRTYDWAVGLRAVTSVDGMTADWYPFEHAFLAETATRLINEVRGVNRVFYDVTSKPPGTIELE